MSFCKHPNSSMVDLWTDNNRLPGAGFVDPSMKAQEVMSARQRLLKRPSIHNSKLPKIFEMPTVTTAAEPHARRTAVPPPTQLVNRTNPRKRKEPEPEMYTERITRSQLKNPEQGTEQAEKPKPSKKVAVEPTVTKRKKPNAASVLTKSFAQPAQLFSGRMKEKKPDATLGPSNPSEPTQLIVTSPSKRRKPNAALLSKTAQAHGENDDDDRPLQYAQDVLRSSPRKTAPKPIACINCRQRHRACDRARPVCGECTKRSIACQYPDSAGKDAQALKPKLSSPQKKPMQKTARADPSRSSANIISEQESSSRTMSPRKAKAPTPTNPLPSGASSSTTATSRRRVIPNITDYDTYLRMRAQHEIP